MCIQAHSQSGSYCIQNRFSETAFFDSSQISVSKNVVYSVPKKWPGTGVDTLKMDLYYPSSPAETLNKRPCIVFFYGGAWLTGNKNDAGIQQKCFEWARRGFVVAAPNYRLGWNCAASDLLAVCVFCQGNYYDLNTATYRGAQDGKAAMRFMVANQNTYKIDTSVMFVGGESAGSFNANHTAHWDHKYGTKVFNGNPYKMLGSLDSAGGNIGLPFRIKGVINSCGAVVNDTAMKLKKIPTVFFHDEADCVVPYQINQVINCCATSFFYAKGSSNLYNELTTAKVPAELHHVPGLTPAHCSYPAITLVKESSCFIKKILCGLSPTGSTAYPTVPAISCNSLQTNAVKNYTINHLKIGPIPADEYLNITELYQVDFKSVSIYNYCGQVFSLTVKSIDNGIVLNTKELPAGMYMLRVDFQSGRPEYRTISVVH